MTHPDCVVLLIERTPQKAGTYHHLLEQRSGFSYRVLPASDDAQILTLCQTQQVKGILLEFGLPTCRSLDRLSQLVTHLGAICPPIIAVGRDDAEVAVQALKAGAADYLVRDRLTAEKLHRALSLAAIPDQPQGLEQSLAGLLRNTRPHEREEWFRLIADAVPQIVWTTDAEGRVDFLNQQWSDYTGVPFEVGTAADIVADFVHPDDVPETVEAFGEALQTGASFSVEHRIRAADGTYRWFLVRAESYRDPLTGEIVGWFGISVDIHDRKRLEANVAFLSEIMADFAPLKTAEEIMQIACAKTAAHLGLSRCLLVSIHEPLGEAQVVYDFGAANLPSLVGTYRIADFHTQDEVQALAHGRSIVVNDVADLPRTSEAADRFTGLQIGALVNAPYVSGGQWKFVLSAMQTTPRVWSQAEVELLQELSARVCLRIERAQAEVALRLSEARYRSLFESMDEGFCIVQVIFDEAQMPVDCRYVETNPAFEQQTGLQNALGKTVQELVPNIESFWLDIYSQVARTGDPTRFAKYSRSLGRWFDAYAFRTDDPQEHKVAILFNDISERKHAEAQLRAREVELTEAQRLGNFGSWYWDAKTDETTGSDQLLRIYGFDPATDVLPNFKAQDGWLYPHDSWERLNAEAQQALATGIGYELDVPAFRRGTPIWITIRSETVDGADGSVVGLRGTVQDITERKQAELERERLLEAEQQARAIAEAAREEAQAANRVKDEFLAVLSHELRSPLNPILGWAKLLQSGKLDSAKTQTALATIERNAKLQSELIEDLLNVSRILRGKLSLNIAPVHLTSVIQAAIETVRLAAEAKSIQVDAILAPNEALVSGDSMRLQQVVWNLLSNAVKFTPEGGRVAIHLSYLDDCAYITVSDTGQGIEPDFLPHVFEYFRQADAATTRKFGGLGLGLAIVRNLVEMHGGLITADSPGTGAGATFTVSLPLMPAGAASSPNGSLAQPTATLNGTQVLVVDDEPDSRDFVAFVLEQAGAKVLTAATAREALTTLLASKPDVLLSDIGMPDMDGYMLMQRVRALPPEQGGRVPAIAVTAYAGDFNQQQALQAGFQQHVAKPIEPEVLIRLVETLAHA